MIFAMENTLRLLKRNRRKSYVKCTETGDLEQVSTWCQKIAETVGVKPTSVKAQMYSALKKGSELYGLHWEWTNLQST